MKQQQQTLEETATSVLASGDVMTLFVASQLQMVSSIAAVTELEVEDFVLSEVHHRTVLPLLQSMLLSSYNKKNWKTVHFSDTISLEDFAEWQASKSIMMRGIELHEDYSPKDWCNGKLAWKASISIPANADLQATFFDSIHNDSDIFDLTMRDTPQACFLDISAGWSSRTTAISNLMQSLGSAQKELQVVKKKHRISDESASSHSSSSSRRCCRRQRKRGKRMPVQAEREGSPDYDWTSRTYTATVSRQ